MAETRRKFDEDFTLIFHGADACCWGARAQHS
jgi:hypothetical protein